MRCRDCEDVITDEPITLHTKCFHDLHDSRDTLLALVVAAKQKAEGMLAAIIQRFPEEEGHPMPLPPCATKRKPRHPGVLMM
jgi:hypothetical protein